MRTAKIASALAIGTLLLGAGSALAQNAAPTDYPTPTGNVVVPSTNTSGASTTGTGGSGASSNTAGGASTTGATTATTPGIPNTGTGGDATTNLIILGVAALVAVGAGVYTVRRWQAAQ